MRPNPQGARVKDGFGTMESLGLALAVPVGHVVVLCALGTYSYYFVLGRYLDRTTHLLPWVWKHILVNPEYYYSFTQWYPISILAGLLVGVVSFSAFALTRPKPE